ncbi:unnamed protein product [Closterium sp. Naga37s-1]|nr:unnamed protein product [Closterium sp. Naga37s-1]
MAAERAIGAVNELIKEAVLAAVGEELAALKEEVDELRHMLATVQGDLAAVKGELAVVKRELANHKGIMAEQRVEISRASVVGGLRRKSRKRRKEVTVGFAQEEERTEVPELSQPRATAGLAAGKDRQAIQGN